MVPVTKPKHIRVATKTVVVPVPVAEVPSKPVTVPDCTPVLVNRVMHAVGRWKQDVQHVIFSKHFPFMLHDESWRPVAVGFFLGCGLTHDEVKEAIKELERHQLYWKKYTDQ